MTGSIVNPFGHSCWEAVNPQGPKGVRVCGREYLDQQAKDVTDSGGDGEASVVHLGFSKLELQVRRRADHDQAVSPNVHSGIPVNENLPVPLQDLGLTEEEDVDDFPALDEDHCGGIGVLPFYQAPCGSPRDGKLDRLPSATKVSGTAPPQPTIPSA
jgi:hypothetical protein